jgi:uncharacterized protein
MRLEKKDIINAISKIRDEIGHEDIEPDITNIIFNKEKSQLLIITSDRPEKSLVIGKGGWVVGKLKERLKVKQIHVESYSDIIMRKYRMKLALKKLEEIMGAYDNQTNEPLVNLRNLLKKRIEYPYNMDDLLVDIENKINITSQKSVKSNSHKAIVALSGGVDSSFALVIAQIMGFEPLAVTVDPGDIILPRYFRDSVENLTRNLRVEHHYLKVDMTQEIKGALEGRYHPCGRCSNVIEKAVLEYANNEKIPFLIFGDLLATGAQSLVKKGDVLRINLPAQLSATKGETKTLAGKYGVSPTGGYGCPLLGEVKKKYSYMNRFSIQRVLRETRAGILEPGEALDMIMSLCKK